MRHGVGTRGEWGDTSHEIKTISAAGNAGLILSAKAPPPTCPKCGNPASGPHRFGNLGRGSRRTRRKGSIVVAISVLVLAVILTTFIRLVFAIFGIRL